MAPTFVQVRLETIVTDIDSQSVTVRDSNGQTEVIEAVTKVWAAGVSASPLAAQLAEQTGAGLDRAGRMTDINGEQVSLAEYAGQMLLIVNVASQCGLTPQYAGLRDLHHRFDDVQVLGFPCNQFGQHVIWNIL